MAFFIESYIPCLYVADSSTQSGRGFVAFLVPPKADRPDKAPELADALQNPRYRGTFVFSAGTPPIGNPTEAQAFYDWVFTQSSAQTRALLWVRNIECYPRPGLGAGCANLLPSCDRMAIAPDGSAVLSALAASLIPSSLQLNVVSGALIKLTGSTLLFSSAQAGMSVACFSGSLGPDAANIQQVSVDFNGPLRGCLRFGGAIARGSLMLYPMDPAKNRLPMGFRLMYQSPKGYCTGFFPLAMASTDAGKRISFTMSIDPTDAFNADTHYPKAGAATLAERYASRRTFLNFDAGSTAYPSAITSTYATTFGASVGLQPVAAGEMPARLVLARGQNTTDYYLTPEGDFTLAISSAAGTNDHFLLAGMQGTEFFGVTAQSAKNPGDRLRFISGCPAWVPMFPFEPASPVGPPQQQGPLLTPDYTTAWATLLPASGNALSYVAQPKGAALFGHDALIAGQQASLFGHVAPGFAFVPDANTTFPLIPYAGAFVDQTKDKRNPSWLTQSQMQQLENLVVGPTRRQQVALLAPAPPAPVPTDPPAAPGATITTPAGLLVTLPASGDLMQWQRVLLGQNTDGGRNYTLAFDNPAPQLVEALQTADLLLVAANADYLGSLTPGGAGPAFDNQMSIGGWGMRVNTGQNQAYGDYRNVLIIKGRRGKLYDPTNAGNSLLATPSSWTQPTAFAAPTTGTDPADPSQLANLTDWLQAYFRAAFEADALSKKNNSTPYFGRFTALAQDIEWTGVLLLRVDLATMPGSLAGIVAGVADTSAFNAHHLAIDISPVKRTGTNAALDHPSTMSGLIYYVDPDFTDTQPYATLPPATGGNDYDFRLLTLKVLFENTAVKSFESYAQLTLGRLFGSPVTGTANVDGTADASNPYNNLLLQGSLQMTGGQPVYNLSTTQQSIFQLDSNIIQQVEITNALLTTRAPDKASDAAYWFGLQGNLDFCPLQYITTSDDGIPPVDHPFDLFSYGSGDKTSTGLAFSSLGIRMTYPLATPLTRALTFDASELKFDLSLSTPRDASLVANFALDEVVLLSGAGTAGPDSLGFLPVIPDMRLDGLSGDDDWYGLKFLLKMGTPGELAGKASLNAYLLLAWNPGSTADSYAATVSLALPGTSGGASLISLQNVLKLSIGQIRLAFAPPAPNPPAGAPQKCAFLLMFTDIALTFLGLLKIPPTGSTVFYLFGNSNAGGKASGLGWYTMYKKAPPAQDAAALAAPKQPRAPRLPKARRR